MTLTEFQQKIIRANWYDKYWFFLLYAAITCWGFFLLYDVIAHQEKYDKYGTRYLGYFSFVFLIFLGARGLYLVPNRYKVLSVHASLSIDKKKEVVVELIKKLNNPFYDTVDTFYNFRYKKNWWTSEYKVYLSYDSENFFISVQGVTGGYYGSGIVDFGGTEKFRQRLVTYLTEIIDKQ
jgi:hypothetical protein